MLDEARSAHYTIWVVAFLLYVCDAAKLLSPRDLLLVEAGRGRLAPIFSGTPFTLAGRTLAFAPLLMPHRAVFVAPWGQAWITASAVNAVLDSLARLRASLRAVRIVAGAGFVALFVVGPVLTLLLGPGAAVVFTAAVLYPTILIAIGVLWWRRRAFGLTVPQALGVSAEILVCPAFLPNLVRKIAARHRLDGDAAQILSVAASPETREAFLATLESRTGELIEEVSDDHATQEQLRRYLAEVRAAR